MTANTFSAAREQSAPLPAAEALARWPLLPIRRSESAHDPERRADHARTEGWHRRGIAVAVHIQYRFVASGCQQAR